MTQQEQDQHIDRLRNEWKQETDPIKRKIIEKRVLLLKKIHIHEN